MAPSAPKVPSFSFRSNLVILGGRPAYLSNDVGHPASGLAFGHSVCNKESSASSRTSFTTCHQDGQKLAGYVAQCLGTILEATLRLPHRRIDSKMETE